MRSFAAGLSALDHKHGATTFSEGNGQREAYDASANDDYVPSLHLGIVKEQETQREDFALQRG